MSPAPLPLDEPQRLAALQRTGLLDSLPEPVFDDIAQLAALICGVPTALVSLVDAQRQWFKARVGMQATETPREQAFCAHAILAPQTVMVVHDALADPRFSDNPMVVGEPHIRFYAGAPIVLPSGHALGTVCAVDRQPHDLKDEQREALHALARQASRLIEWRRLQTQERSQLQALWQQDRERLFRATALATSDLNLTTYVDRDHVVRYANDRQLRYRQRQRSEVEGRHMREMLGAELYDGSVKSELSQAFAGRRVQFTRDIDYPAVGRRRMSVTYLPAHDDDGSVCGVVIRSEDVHEIELARQALEQAHARQLQHNAMQTRFIHMVSHDLREPVNTICNFTGLLDEALANQLPPTQARHLGFVQQGGERLRALLDDLLDFVRLGQGDSSELELAWVDLDEVMGDVLADLQDLRQREAAHLLPGPLPRLQGDRSLLRVLIQNLLSNALKFHAPGQPPVVSWGSQARDGFTGLWIRDQGIGIEPQQQHKLFGAFSRLVTRRDFPGTGLGLAICHRITELHGGHIDVASAPGQGATFSVWLPSGNTTASPGPTPACTS